MNKTNRLNFSHIVNKNLGKAKKIVGTNAKRMVKKILTDPQEVETKESHSEDFYKEETYAANLNYKREHKNLTHKRDGIVAQVYTQLKERKSSPNRLKRTKLSKPNTSQNKKDSKFNQKEKVLQRKVLPDRLLVQNTQKSHIDPDNIQNLSIPQLKTKTSYIQQQKRNSETKSPVADSYNFENYNRMEKATARQVELQSMLAQHKQLRDHLQSIAQDIFAMRHCLDDVKHRLNNSLKTLENKKTYSECHGLEKSLKCHKCTAKEN